MALLGAAAMVVAALAAAQGAKPRESRGELLYSTYCVGCHTAKVHWRDRKRVTNWDDLKSEVRRWQKTAGLSLDDDDIAAVASYLNRVYYHFPAADGRRAGEVGVVPRAGGSRAG